MERRLAAILAADVVGYSRLIRADEEGTIAALKALHADLIDPKIAEHHGRIVKLMGDGTLAEFPSVVDAVRAAAEIQQAAAERNATRPADKRIEFRVGINLGDVVIDGDDIHGDGVNVAARLEALAEPGGLCISSAVYEQVRDRIKLPFRDMGEQKVKNIDRPVRVWRLAATSEPPPSGDTVDAEPLSPPDKPSIAVLSFTNLSGDPEQEYFSDGITEDIITELSRFRWLLVIARNSSFTFKGRAVMVQDVGRELGVAYVLEGSVRKAGRRVRVTAQLIEAANGRHIWAERYDRDLEDIFAVQDEITRSIAAAIEPELGSVERERSRRKSPESLNAWDWYQRGLWLMHQSTKNSSVEALRHVQTAARLSPDFAPAHAAWAYVLIQDVIHGYTTAAAETLDQAHRRAEAAVALDDRDAMAHMVLGRTNLLQCKHADSIAELETAIDLNPSYVDAYHGLGFCLVFSGRVEEALPHFETAIRLSPQDPHLGWFHEMRGSALLILGRYEEAARSANKAVRRPSAPFWAHATYTASLGHLGRLDEARTALEELLRRNPDFSCEFVRKYVYYNKVTAHLDRYIDGLKKAGLE